MRAGAHARESADEDRRGHSRRPGGADTALRLAAAAAARARRGCLCSPWASSERRREDDLRVYVRARPCGRCRADGGVRRVHGPRAVPRKRSRSASRSVPSCSSWACSSATRLSTCSPTRGVSLLLASRSGSPPRRPRHASRRSDEPRCGPPRTDALDGVAPDYRGRPSARPGERARPAVEVRGSRPRGRRGLLPWPRGRRQPCRRHSGHRRGRRDGHPRSARRSEGARGRARRGSRRSCSRRTARHGGSCCRQTWLATPEEYARRIRELVDAVTG